MTTSNQAQAARRNGAKSHGPITPEGKAASARNALKHGLSAKIFELIDPEEKRAFAEIEAELIETYIAVTPVQKRLVTELAIAMWRQRIVGNMEMALLNAMQRGEATANEGGAGLPSLNAIYRYRARIERDLKSARESLKELQAARVQMFNHKLKKAKEFKELKLLKGLRAEIGDEAFTSFCLDCTNEPKPSMPEPENEPQLNREQRRRLEAMARNKGKGKS